MAWLESLQGEDHPIAQQSGYAMNTLFTWLATTTSKLESLLVELCGNQRL